jgi:hypothetical protein
MGKWLKREKSAWVALITECSMADNPRGQFPVTQFIKPCNLCPRMQRITLQNIYACLRDMKHVVEVPADVGVRARVALERMLAVGRRECVRGARTCPLWRWAVAWPGWRRHWRRRPHRCACWVAPMMVAAAPVR